MTVRTTCGAATADGKPCNNWRGLNADDLCWRHDGRPALAYKPRKAHDGAKTCRRCERRRPAEAFNVGPTNPKTGIAYRKRVCRDCEERARRAAGIPRRHRRYDGHGNVWCNNCKRYRGPDHFRRHPYRPHTYWSYCQDCCAVLDRMRVRPRNIRGTPEWRADIERRSRQHREHRTREMTERKRFVANAVTLLRRRGLTKMEICRLAGVSITSLLDWERGERKVTPNAAARIGVLLHETADLPVSDEPAYRRRLPHPEMPRLMARVAPQIAALPVRTRWKTAA